MNRLAAKTGKCERTGSAIPLSEGLLVADAETGEWSFISEESDAEPYDYEIEFKTLLASPEAFVDWMAHLAEKTWFKPRKFFDFFDRFRDENNLYNSL